MPPGKTWMFFLKFSGFENHFGLGKFKKILFKIMHCS